MQKAEAKRQKSKLDSSALKVEGKDSKGDDDKKDDKKGKSDSDSESDESDTEKDKGKSDDILKQLGLQNLPPGGAIIPVEQF